MCVYCVFLPFFPSMINPVYLNHCREKKKNIIELNEGKKSLAAAHPLHHWREKKKEEEEEKKKKERRRECKNSLAASHPSMKGQRPQERWIGVYTGNHRRHPLPCAIFRLRSALPVTGVLSVSRGRRESILYVGGRTRDSIIGEATFRSQSASE